MGFITCYPYQNQPWQLSHRYWEDAHALAKDRKEERVFIHELPNGDTLFELPSGDDEQENCNLRHIGLFWGEVVVFSEEARTWEDLNTQLSIFYADTYGNGKVDFKFWRHFLKHESHIESSAS